MPRTRQPAAPAPAPIYTRAWQQATASARWAGANCFILAIIAFNGAASFNHMTYLAGHKGGQHGADVQLVATIFDLFVFAMRIESQRDKKRGTFARRAWLVTTPVLLQMVALFFSVLANYATASKGFWGTTFAISPPLMVMLGILMLERRYRLDALARTGTGTGQASPEAPAGTGAGTAPAAPRTGTGTAPRTAPDPAGTGTGGPADPAGEGPEADVVQLRDYFAKDGRLIPAGIVVPPDTDRAGQLIAVREATVKYLARNLDGKPCPAWALAAALRKNKTWVLAARAEIDAEDRAAEAAKASAAADADTAPKELSA